MWLCTKFGFFSIVQKTPGEVHIRARAKQDLVNLRDLISATEMRATEKWKIHRTAPADYRYRIVIPPASLPYVMTALARDLDYSNFKSVIASLPDQSDKLAIYSAFHHDMERWQNRT